MTSSSSQTATEIKVGVLGAGAIGSFIGAILSKQQNMKQVILVGRKTLLQCCRENDHKLGLNSINVAQQKVIEGFGTKLDVTISTECSVADNAKLVVTDNVELLQDCDVVIVAVKSTHTAEAAQALLGLKKRCLVYSFQNGVGNTKIIREVTENNKYAHVLGAVVVFNVRWDRPTNTFFRASDTEMVLESPEPLDSRYLSLHKSFLGALKAAHFEVKDVSTRDIANHQYSKLLINLTNAANTLDGGSIPDMFENAGWREVMVLMMKEAIKVYSAAGIKTVAVHRGNPVYFPYLLSVPEWLFNCLVKRMFPTNREAKTSMLQDMIAGTKTEVDFLNGAVVELAKQIGLEARVNERVTKLIHQAEEKRASAEDWTMTPKDVLRFLQE